MAGASLSVADLAALAARAVYFRPAAGERVERLEGFVVDRCLACATAGSGFLATGFADREAGWLMLAVCGTDEPVDLAACATLAICQYRPNRDALLDYAADPAWTRVTLTGHSLGGAICQYLAYDLVVGHAGIEARLDVLTFNGLGGLLGLSRLHGEVSDARLRRIRAVHFAHPDDVVPRIGGNIAGELRLLASPPDDRHGLVPFLPAPGRSALADCIPGPDRPFRIAATADRLGARLRQAMLDWVAGRRFRAGAKLLVMLPAVPRGERLEVLRLLAAMSTFPFRYRRAMRASAERLLHARAGRRQQQPARPR